MIMYFAYNAKTTDWVWNKEFTSPNAVEEWLKERSSVFSDYEYLDFAMDAPINSRFRSCIDHAVNRANRAYMDKLQSDQKLAAEQALQDALTKAAAEGKAVVREIYLSKAALDLYISEIKVKEGAIVIMQGKIEAIEKNSTIETAHLDAIKIKPIKTEVDLMQARLDFIRLEVKSHQDTEVVEEEKEEELTSMTVGGSTNTVTGEGSPGGEGLSTEGKLAALKNQL